MSSTPRVAPRRSLAARAILFVAMSAFAVPACQHFEGGGKSDREQASVRLVSPPVAPPVVEHLRPAVHRG